MILLFYRLPDLIIVVLAAWLGLSLLVRDPHDRTIRVFAVLCTSLVLYGITAIQTQLTTSPNIAHILGRLQLMAAVLTPAAFLHFIVVFMQEEQLQPLHLVMISISYTIGAALSIYALFGALPEQNPPFPAWTRWGEPQFPGGFVAWGAVLQRLVPLLIGAWVVWDTIKRSDTAAASPQEIARHRFVLKIVGVGVSGGLLAIAAREFSFCPTLPRLLIVVALGMLIYALFANRVLITSRVAQREFLSSVLGSLFTMLFIVIVILLEWGAGELLHINIPLVTTISIVSLVAAFGPLGEWLRSLVDRRFYPREFDYSRFLKSLSDELLEQGDLHEQLQASLSSICGALDVQTGLVATPAKQRNGENGGDGNNGGDEQENDGKSNTNGFVPQAVYGEDSPPTTLPPLDLSEGPQELSEPWEAWPLARWIIPLQHGDEPPSLLILGERRPDHQPARSATDGFTQIEQDLLNHLSGYLALTINHARAREEQEQAMAELAEQSKALRHQQEQLSQQAIETVRQGTRETTSNSDLPSKLAVYALGSLRVENEGEEVTRWGGSKAGTYQAEALFAFLFERRGKGVTKDEVEEVIWPDLEISKADSAFHRTVAALRRTLEPGLRRGNQSRTILYHHDRYWLEPDVVVWSDVADFLAAAEQGATYLRQQEYDQALEALEQANTLYRGDYMDDCPFFGDSSYVEDRREDLRERYINVQLNLAAVYEAQGRTGEAISAYRHALTLSMGACQIATDGLTRLQEHLTT